jgi:hypothetical protein
LGGNITSTNVQAWFTNRKLANRHELGTAWDPKDAIHVSPTTVNAVPKLDLSATVNVELKTPEVGKNNIPVHS